MLRRTFLQGCSLLAGVRLSGLAWASPAPAPKPQRLVLVSLRGGWDALNVVIPRGQDQKYYLQARPNLGLRQSLKLDDCFGFNPALRQLHSLWGERRLAVVVATGLTSLQTRSHFESIASIESASAGGGNGWLARYLQTLPGKDFAGLAVGAPSLALQGYSGTLTLDSLADLDFQLPREDLLLRLYGQDSAGRALEALRLGRRLARKQVSADYPESEFGARLREASRMLRCPELGVRALTLELDGWDTHIDQAPRLEGLLEELDSGLGAFARDLQGQGVTVVLMSEFGRRLAENGAVGTDHGHGSVMLVLGDGVVGGIYGSWPGLAKEQLYDLQDLQVTCDYRRVLWEVLSVGMGCCEAQAVFPGAGKLEPLNFMRAIT
ncbi:DUF1501 domain-containing protein [bacterium]|nr:DUF1501 domain-containing protein [bacterium]